MKIKYLAHASFLMTSASGAMVLTDPYTASETIQYAPIDEPVDVITISHSHEDHSYVAPHHQSTLVLRESTTVHFRDIEITGFDTFHDSQFGQTRGENIVFTYKLDGMTCCHLGDLGHVLDGELLQRIGPVDVLFLPVGGIYTVSQEEMTVVMESLTPRLCIPMHYKTEKVKFNLLSVEAFVQDKKPVHFVHASQIEISPAQLPSSTEIIVMTPGKL